MRAARHILGQPAFDRFNGGEISPGPGVQTDDEILEWVARDAETALHPSCTCRMGVDEMSVIDPDTLGVHGVEGVRVVDASSMPYITNGNIYAPVMMLAEKAADRDPRQHAADPRTGRLLPPSVVHFTCYRSTIRIRSVSRTALKRKRRRTRGCVTSSPQWREQHDRSSSVR